MRNQAYLARNGFNGPGPDGAEVRVEAGEVFFWHPPAWLIEQGEVTALCDGGEQPDPDVCPCRWCECAAMDLADQMFLEAHGWKPPEPPEVLAPQSRTGRPQRRRRGRP